LGGGPKYTFQGKSPDRQNNDSPGPGGYDANESLTKSRVQAYKMSNTQRTQIVDKTKTGSPGPGIYDSPSKLGKGVSYSIGEKRESKNRNDLPGPGSYEDHHSNVRSSNPAHRISPSGKKGLDYSKDQTLGPGFYDVKSGPGGPSYTIGERSPDRNRNDSPGPGAYDSNEANLRARNPSYSFSPARSGRGGSSSKGSPNREFDNRDF